MSWKWNYFLKYIKIIINNYKIRLGDIENSKEQDFWYEKQKQWQKRKQKLSMKAVEVYNNTKLWEMRKTFFKNCKFQFIIKPRGEYWKVKKQK